MFKLLIIASIANPVIGAMSFCPLAEIFFTFALLLRKPLYPMEEKDENQELRELIPFMKNWKTFYAIVLGELVVLIVVFYFFSRAFS